MGVTRPGLAAASEPRHPVTRRGAPGGVTVSQPAFPTQGSPAAAYPPAPGNKRLVRGGDVSGTFFYARVVQQ